MYFNMILSVKIYENTLFGREKFKDSIQVASIGCGNIIDYWGLVEALDEIRNGWCQIKYRGVDTIDGKYG